MELLQIIIQRGIFNKSPPLLFYLIHGNTKKRSSVIEEYDVEEDVAREDIQDFLDKLTDGGILTEDDITENR